MRQWWSKTRGLDPAVYASWRETLSEVPGRPARILAWTHAVGVGPEPGVVVLSPAAVSVRTEDAWRHVGWHEIERGGWNVETAQLRWQTYSGKRGAVALPDPARVPAVFQERVQASIVFERFVPATPGSDRGVIINGRRDLADTPSSITWHTTLTRGVTWRTPGIRELADATLAEVRHEYDER
ncbi:hypothetical protein MLP_33540 [Microlunatus phosphovorus NM-1]|uniref:Uncharacterized protein n=1 Tax=Microlunatus phosphovorus (strain ATCC 700054 / DSM 10555 / JCM 9379 / NBRC 101784 / NCIMB 13414 / VKM Ac-1990 / NM-1) TaxID=1032480 RepID=F5XMB1_MICPN|nr:hypothetical protein [Microlunatus phosphovorus]BAK36368.1 hypothetical protein MLP_33540 [Microlunatus phosphovorus NM-1]